MSERVGSARRTGDVEGVISSNLALPRYASSGRMRPTDLGRSEETTPRQWGEITIRGRTPVHSDAVQE